MESTRPVIATVVLIIAISMVVGGVGATQTTITQPTDQELSQTTETNITLTTTENKTTPGLDSALDELIDAKDREAFATQHDIEFTDEGAHVVIKLEPDTTLPSGYDVTILASDTTANVTRHSAYVPVDELRPLVNTSAVDHIGVAGVMDQPANVTLTTTQTNPTPTTTATTSPGFTPISALVGVCVVIVGFVMWRD